MTITSPWAFTERAKFVEVSERVREGDYFKVIKKMGWVREPRGRKETKDIEKRLVAAAIERAKAETEGKFPPEPAGD